MRPIYAERPMPGDQNDRRGPHRTVRMNLAESPLGWLWARKLITDRQCAAGELLRRDYEQAGLGPRVTMRWDSAPPRQPHRAGTDPAGAAQAHLSARQRFDAAMATLGPGLADISWRLVCAGDGMAAAEKALGWPGRSGRLVLTLALDRIADYYRVP